MLTELQTIEAPSPQPWAANQSSLYRPSILTDEDLLFVYGQQELKTLGSSDALFGDSPRYSLSVIYMNAYQQRKQDMAKRDIPIGTRPIGSGFCWGIGYQTVADEL
ncbi:MAG: hypothetical protein F6K42_25140 [Leptolyngbya sp. SIO1D8]|nr:hypothetical protein [Leptolyngbya sp. SIO1D8]